MKTEGRIMFTTVRKVFTECRRKRHAQHGDATVPVNCHRRGQNQKEGGQRTVIRKRSERRLSVGSQWGL